MLAMSCSPVLSASGSFPVARELARHVHQGVREAGFDPVLSLRLNVDYGISQVYGAVFPHVDMPLVPIVVNTLAPPLPSIRRCYNLGVAVGNAIRAFEGATRVLVVGCGGLSHWLPAYDAYEDPSLEAKRREFLIGGRIGSDEAAAFDDQLIELRGINRKAQINADWDRQLLRALHEGRVQELLALEESSIEMAAGNGGQEVRSWLAAVGAWGGEINGVSYEAVRPWFTGMGIALALRTPSAELRAATEFRFTGIPGRG